MNVIVDGARCCAQRSRMINEVPHAVPHKSWPLRFKRIDISTLPATERQAELERLLIESRKFGTILKPNPGFA